MEKKKKNDSMGFNGTLSLFFPQQTKAKSVILMELTAVFIFSHNAL